MSVRQIFNNPHVYALSQRLNPFTIRVYEDLIRRRVIARPGARLLDIGCGCGAHRKYFRHTDYWGIDINPDYVEVAQRRFGEGFEVGDATRLEYPDGAFDLTLCVATFHHLDDAQAAAAIRESWRVIGAGGRVHIIDPVIPADARAWMKRWVFANDRGRFQRTEEQMRDLALGIGPITEAERVEGRLHDVIYLRLDKS